VTSIVDDLLRAVDRFLWWPTTASSRVDVVVDERRSGDVGSRRRRRRRRTGRGRRRLDVDSTSTSARPRPISGGETDPRRSRRPQGDPTVDVRSTTIAPPGPHQVDGLGDQGIGRS
jgi:hypothetical protein